MWRLHIIGSGPRTGTSLLQSLCSHGFNFELISNGEADVLWNPRVEPGKSVLTKDPNGLLLVRPYFKADPSLHVLCIVRDPRDMVCSIHRGAPDKFFADITFWRHFMIFHEEMREKQRYSWLRYEDLVRDPDKCQQNIQHHFPFLEEINSFSSFYKTTAKIPEQLKSAMNGIRPITSSSIGSWRRHLPRIKGQLEEFGDFITPGLIQFGYEKDESWKEVLAEVETEHSPSVVSGDLTARRMPYSKYLRIREYLRVHLRRLSLDPSRVNRRDASAA